MTVYVDELVAHPPPKDATTRRAGAKHGRPPRNHLRPETAGEEHEHHNPASVPLEGPALLSMAPPNERQ